MSIHAIICTRSREDISETTDKLLTYLNNCSIKVYLIVGAKTIFGAYEGAYKKINPNPDDVIIFCHDDIEIRSTPLFFMEELSKSLGDKSTGFVGAAGTTKLNENAVWWDHELWKQGYLRGKVIHVADPRKLPESQFGIGQQIFEEDTFYGPPGEVVALDGLFLVARPHVIEDVGLSKPDYFEGEWDFYDIHYTTQAFLKGYKNKVMNINILHNSRGELVGRDSWHKNREAFIAHHNLPYAINKAT